MTFYNEFDAYPAAWLRNLIDAGHLPQGMVDERSIVDVEPKDLEGYDACHFFAGIGGWPLALRLADWSGGPVWTGSCPCQPFSTAGKRGGHTDERHLWPAWFRLIRECCPPVIFGEQVASKAGLDWLDAVRADLEGQGYAVGAADLCAASVGAPHIRQRIFFVAVSECWRREGADVSVRRARLEQPEIIERGRSARLVHAADLRRHRLWEWRSGKAEGKRGVLQSSRGCEDGLVGHAERWTAERHGLEVGAAPSGDEGTGRQRQRLRPDPRDGGEHGERCPFCFTEIVVRRRDGRRSCPKCRTRFVGNPKSEQVGRARLARQDFWWPCDWLPCRDGKARPVEPGSFPLAHGIPARVGRLRAYGNAIVPQVAAEFVRIFMEIA